MNTNPLAVKCGLRDPMLKKAFLEAVEAFNTRSPAFFAPDGKPAASNSAASMFWRGFNDVRCAYRDRRSDGTFAYAYWKAGKGVRAALTPFGETQARDLTPSAARGTIVSS